MNGKEYHRRHHSVENNVNRVLHRAGSSDSMLLDRDQGRRTTSTGNRHRPGSDSDIIESKGSSFHLQHHDSMMLAYHQRPSVVAGHTVSVLNNAPVRQTKPVFVWTKTETNKWLRKHIPENMGKYAELLPEHDITGKTLLLLNDSKLARMGITEATHRKIILNEILKLQIKNYMQCFKGLQTAGMFENQ